MREGGRYIADKDGHAKRVEPMLGTGKDAKPNPDHHEYPDAPQPAAADKKEGK